jgi:beta-galactosidase
MLYGASYYAEYQPHDRLDADLDLMVEAGFTLIRVGESTWASYEPADGSIGFDALARVIDAAGERGLRVIVGTPTYAIPPWLARAHPEIMAVPPSGQAVPYGARQNVDFTHPVYRRYAERIVRAMGERFGHHEAVIGFQVDNEIGVYELANPAVVERFRAHVLERFGSVEEINRRWGLTYWSHRLTDIDDLWHPAGNTNPGYALEWGRFQARLTVEFLSWQRDLLRPLLDERMFILHDVVGGDSLASTDVRGVPAAMDRTGANIYFPMQDSLALPDAPAEETTPLGPWWLVDRGASTLAWRADVAWSLRGERGEPFAVTEAQAGSIGEHATAIPPYPGQLRLVAHALLARGADLIAYWHWHTLHYGAETWWGGVLGHDLEPGRIWREVAGIGKELRELGAGVDGARPDADVAILSSRDSLRALNFSSPLLQPGTDRADPHAYHRILMRCYDGAFDAGAQVRILHEDGAWDETRVVIVPALYVATDETLARLTALAERGVHVLVTFRSGVADETATVRAQRAPGPLRAAAGIGIPESTTLAVPRPLVAGVVPGFPAEGATAEGWADLVELESHDVEVLATYRHPFLDDVPAITTRAVGAGRLTWIGTLPDRGTMRALVDWALAERGVVPVAASWGELPASVRVTSSRRQDGSRLWFVAHHGWGEARVAIPAGVAPLTGAASGELVLGAWGSEILLEESPRG